jgi:hypothetical protein
MAQIRSQIADIDAKIVLILSEDEARALEAIVGYGPEKFIEWFEKNHGKHYISKAKLGIKSLFETTRRELPQHISKLEDARNLLNLPSKKP